MNLTVLLSNFGHKFTLQQAGDGNLYLHLSSSGTILYTYENFLAMFVNLTIHAPPSCDAKHLFYFVIVFHIYRTRMGFLQ